MGQNDRSSSEGGFKKVDTLERLNYLKGPGKVTAT